MSQAELTDVVNLVMLLAFVLGMSMILITLIFRVVEYHRAQWKRPRLLRRDIILFAGLLIPFGAIFVRRYFQVDVTDTLTWNLVTGIPAILAVYYWLWEEIYVVGSTPDDDSVAKG